VSRIATDLVEQRFLDRDGDKLYLGVRLFELGQTVEQPRRLRQLALPVMTELRDATGQTVHLAVLEGRDVVFIAIVRGESTAKPLARVGGRLPAHATALGKAMLAFSPQEVVERVAYGGLIRRTPHTISEPSALLRELAEVHRSGVAVERGECASDRSCVASPILGLGGAPLAAISVAGSVEAMMPERIGAVVRAAAMTLCRRIGGGRIH
jgi:DNA-binding IclR family transcriptional regulator